MNPTSNTVGALDLSMDRASIQSAYLQLRNDHDKLQRDYQMKLAELRSLQ